MLAMRANVGRAMLSRAVVGLGEGARFMSGRGSKRAFFASPGK